MYIYINIYIYMCIKAGTRTVPDGLVGPECSPSRFLMSRVSAKKQSSTCVRVHRVTSLIRIRTPLGDPTVGLCLGSWGVPRGVGVVVWASSGRVTPAGFGRRDCRRKHAPSPSASPPARPLAVGLATRPPPLSAYRVSTTCTPDSTAFF